jgi:xylulokinase
VAEDCLIGIDLGTTALKAILIDTRGRRIASYSEAYPIRRPQPGHAEQDPNDWLKAMFNALQTFVRSHGADGVRAIGICSQVNTHVFVGAGGVPVLPAITWQDTRAAEDGAALDARVTAAQKIAWLGAPIPIDASHALARMAWLARVHPHLYEQTRHVLLPKDFLVKALTGAVGSDSIAAVGLTNADGYVPQLLELVPGAAERLPPLHPFTHVAGRVGELLPCEGVPVVVGAMDAWGGMFGVGVVGDGDAMYQSGTSEIPGIVSSTIHPTPGVILFPPYEGIVMHAAPTQSGGAALQWFAGVLGRPPAEVSELAASIGPSDAVPLFLPHLEGERAPFWDAASRGVFARMDARAGAAEMARSVMEGVAFSARLAFESLQQSAGVTVAVANLGGGGARSDAWCQIRADVLGFPLRRTAVPDAAAVGAAILAGLGSGAMPSLADAARQLVTFDRTFEPDPALRGYYDEKVGRYRMLYETLRPFNALY